MNLGIAPTLLEAITRMVAQFQTGANVAQIASGVALTLALGFAWAQIRIGRATARRELAISYLERFTSVEAQKQLVDAMTFWRQNDWNAYLKLGLSRRVELQAIPNLIEEIAAQYNRKLIDRTIGAILLGGTITQLWNAWQPMIKGYRRTQGEWVFYEWQRMQQHVGSKRDAERSRLRRRASWHYRAYGE